MPPRRPSRLDWAMGSLLMVAGIMAFAGLQVQDWAGGWPHWWQLSLTLSVPVLFGFCFRDMLWLVHRQRQWNLVRHLPVNVQVQQQDDGSFVAFVTRVDGEPRLLTLPDGYDPREDEGRRLLELLAEPE